MNSYGIGLRMLSILWTPREGKIVYGMNFETLLEKSVRRKIQRVSKGEYGSNGISGTVHEISQLVFIYCKGKTVSVKVSVASCKPLLG